MSEFENTESYQSRLHWIIFLKPIGLMLVPFILWYFFNIYERQGIVLFLLVGLGWLAMEMVRYTFTSLTIRKTNVIYQTGILVQETKDYPMQKIESIDIRQTIIGTIFNYGDIIITGSGGTQQLIIGIEHPLTCRRYIEQFMHS
ncbi:MAG: PH domain-containing protein [Gammaproteobacteria bacterium]|nr:PH domain-containing protein [Gammaproteobacteria bacterium]